MQINEETKKVDFTQQVTYYLSTSPDNILLVGINLAHHDQLASSMRQFTGSYCYNDRNIISHINTTDLSLK